MPDPCPDRPLVPPAEKPWVGSVEVSGVFTVLVGDWDDITTDEEAQEHAEQVVQQNIREPTGLLDWDVGETEAFRDGQ